MASLIQRKGGWFSVQFYNRAKYPPRKKVPLKTKTRRVAEKLRTQLEDEYALGRFDPWQSEEIDSAPPIRTLAEGKSAFLESRAHLAAKSIYNYHTILEAFTAHTGKDYPIQNVRASHIKAWLSTTNTKAVSRTTYLRHLRAFFRYLVAREAITTDITRQVLLERTPHKHPKFLSPDEVRRLLDAIEAPYEWLRLLIELNCYLGLRRGEICNLRWSDIDLQRRTITVSCTDDFTTKSYRERTIPLCQEALRIINHLRPSCNDQAKGYVFHNGGGVRLRGDFVSKLFCHFRREAKLPEGICFHSTRHTALSWLAQQGCGVEAIRTYAGHSSIIVTQKYMHLSTEAFARQINAAFDQIQATH